MVFEQSGSVESAGAVELWKTDSLAAYMYLYRIQITAQDGSIHEYDGKLVVE